MPTRKWLCRIVFVTSAVACMNVLAGCGSATQVASAGESTANLPDSTNSPDVTDVAGPTDNTPVPSPPAENEGDAPCTDPTNIYVTYVNCSSARVGFVENFRDASYGVLAASILVLEPAGEPGDTRHKCITCPNQAGIRNIQYIRNSVRTWVQYPDDLMWGSFSCGDRITFAFNENGTVQSFVEQP